VGAHRNQPSPRHQSLWHADIYGSTGFTGLLRPSTAELRLPMIIETPAGGGVIAPTLAAALLAKPSLGFPDPRQILPSRAPAPGRLTLTAT
jgi:hypothetical protein